MADTQREYHNRRLSALKTLRTPWEEAWREVDRIIVPGYLRLDPTARHADQGSRIRNDIIDNQAQLAHGTFTSGMQSGMTSQARPWNRLTTRSPELSDNPNVKGYLDLTTRIMRDVMSRSNMYDVFHEKYGALGAIGTAVSYMSPDPIYVVRNNPVIAGHYWIATNALGFVDTLYHMIPMTAHQILQKFNKDSDNIPTAVQLAYDQGNIDETYMVFHAMEPRRERDETKASPRHMPWLSNYWMEEEVDDKMLRESGSPINRVVGSRWFTVSNDPYGYSLGMDALPTTRQLQHTQTRKLEVLDKTTRPPMVGPTALKNQRASLLPGAITYSDEAHSRGGYRPAIDISNFNAAPLLSDIQDLRARIDDIFHVDLFRTLTNMQGVQPRNEFEIAERKEEKLLQLGPALDRLQSEELQPTIGIIYYYLNKAKIIPPLPEEFEGNEGELDIEYTSIMAQAQRAVSSGSIERLASFVGNIAAVKPDVVDKFDADQAVDEYGLRIGAPAKVTVPDEEVAQIRQARAKAAQQAQQAEQMAQAAPAANQAAQAASVLADIDNPNLAPTDLLNQLNLGV